MCGELAKCNIVEEAFSRFASRSADHITGVDCMLTERRRYDEIRSLYANQLASVWMNDSTTETTRTSFNKKIDSFVKGKLEHASEMFSALLEIVGRDGDIIAPSGASPAVSSFQSYLLPCCTGMLTSHDQAAIRSPAHWAVVKIALIKSIRTGVFFDRKYWVRHFKSGNVLKPVYLSSIVMGDKAHQLNNCASKVVYGFTEALRVVSGGQSQGSERSHKPPRGRFQLRQRL
jgi:hypothetical protein